MQSLLECATVATTPSESLAEGDVALTQAAPSERTRRPRPAPSAGAHHLDSAAPAPGTSSPSGALVVEKTPGPSARTCAQVTRGEVANLCLMYSRAALGPMGSLLTPLWLGPPGRLLSPPVDALRVYTYHAWCHRRINTGHLHWSAHLHQPALAKNWQTWRAGRKRRSRKACETLNINNKWLGEVQIRMERASTQEHHRYNHALT